MMKRRKVLGAFAAALTTALTRTAVAGDELVELKGEASRSQLFQRVIAAKKAEPSRFAVEPLSLPGNFEFPSNAAYDDGRPRQNSIFGIDISHYTSADIALERLRQQNVSFVYAKATQGEHNKDGRFGEFYTRLQNLDAGQRVAKGAYHFLSSHGDGQSQADTFCNFVEQYGGFRAGDMPPVMDMEWDVETPDGPDHWQTRSADEIIATALAFLNRVQDRTKVVPMIYTAVSWWKDREIALSQFEKLKAFRLWIADYSKSSRAVEDPTSFPGSAVNLWQFSSSAKLQLGYDGDVDANIFKGTTEQFNAMFNTRLP